MTQLYLESHENLLANVFENFIKVSIQKNDFIPLFCVVLTVYTWLCGLKYTNIKLQTLQDKDMILLPGNNKQGRIGSVMGARYVIISENKKILYIDFIFSMVGL